MTFSSANWYGNRAKEEGVSRHEAREDRRQRKSDDSEDSGSDDDAVIANVARFGRLTGADLDYQQGSDVRLVVVTVIITLAVSALIALVVFFISR